MTLTADWFTDDEMYDHLPDAWCAYHNTFESPGGTVVCGECWHDFGTPDNLLRVALLDGSQCRTPDDVWFCPLCTHDF